MLDLQIALGATVRRLRSEMEPFLSQEKFAAKAGLDRTYQSDLEAGRRNVTLRTLERIATALGIDTGQLMTEVEKERLRAK
jgi:transcriptional regulator with XRE-family HTH domain